MASSNIVNLGPGNIIAVYEQSTSTVYTAGQPINFDTKLIDTQNCVTTGSAWVFTSPMDGYYQVGMVAAANTAPINVLLYKNGASLFYILTLVNASDLYSGSVIVGLDEGDTLSINIDNNTTIFGSSTPPYNCQVSIGLIGN